MLATYTTTTDPDDLNAATGGHPYSHAFRGVDDFVAYLGPTATVWRFRGADRIVLNAYGDPHAALDVVRKMVTGEEFAVGFRCNLPRVPHEPILAAFPAVKPNDWELRWSAAEPPVRPGEDRVAVLTADEFDQINAVLDASLPDAHTRPGSDRVANWYGIRDGSEVLAVAADCTSDRIGRINSIAVRPDRQGSGLGGALTAAVTRKLRAENPSVQLGVMAVNTGAQRLYERLGFTEVHRMTSFSVLAS